MVKAKRKAVQRNISKIKSRSNQNKPTTNNNVKTDKNNKNQKIFGRWHAVPLKGSFMVTAMLGFLISAYWVYPQSFNYGLAFMLIFAVMFIASLVSMTKAPVVKEGSY